MTSDGFLKLKASAFRKILPIWGMLWIVIDLSIPLGKGFYFPIFLQKRTASIPVTIGRKIPQAGNPGNFVALSSFAVHQNGTGLLAYAQEGPLSCNAFYYLDFVVPAVQLPAQQNH
ncbi:MAG: hypothetical protein HZB19_06435 [Chloroflexi bacterium]|nr:hypothetical protein [Chloroflexota bacterium]